MRLAARRALMSMLTLAIAALLPLLGTGVAQAALTPAQVRDVTDTYLYEVSLDSFSDIRARAPYPAHLDWSSDGCSWSPDEPLGYNFLPSCHRHDFGYRNYQLQERFTESNRLRIDEQFRDDMYTQCDGSFLCEGVAEIYYAAVRQFGGSSTSTAEALDRANAHERAREYLTNYLTSTQ
ncbi:phospholipase [Salinactinospora qingdaonensis]|uniref:Phospholipase A2 n=1 Tax=Salinactinospora qingdaonensis TaxID=702744 RepID=A0ABP7FQK7_9ACTN